MSTSATVADTAADIDLFTLFPDEVVTESKLKFVRVPGVAGKVALITLDNGRDHTRPASFGPRGLASLGAALDEAFAAEPAAIVITGKQFIFAAGADLSGIGIPDRDAAHAIVTGGQRTLRRLHDSSIPTFAFVNGLCLGGALELALHCHYRTLSANAAAVAFPEVFLGMLPGWGGTQLLPKAIGPDKAVTVIIENALNTNRMLRPAQALELGVVDALLDSADFLEQSLAWMAGVIAGTTTVDRPAPTDEEWDEALERGRMFAALKTKNATPAPSRALDMIELGRTADLDTGLAAEADALTDLIMSDEFRASLYAFNLTQKRARRPAGAPDSKLALPVTKVGVVGAGLMAAQLAVLFARNLKVPVVLTEVDQDRLDKGLAGIRREFANLAKKGRLSADAANRLSALVSGSLDYGIFADADFVIEAVFEEISVKKQVFAELEKHVRPDCVVATNTSALSVTEMSADLGHPERVVGFHFFNPVALMPLVEIVHTARTSDEALATAFALAKLLKKTPILAADSPGFVVNRLLMRVMGEVLATIDEGTPSAVADASLDPLGLPMSPILLLQLVGPAVALHVSEHLHEEFGDRFPVSANLRRIVDGGHKMLLTWDDEGRQVLTDEVAALWEQGASPSTAEQVRERAMSAVADEARRMLDDGVVQDAADIDLAMLTGAGWPFWLGGITPYLDRTGVSERATGRRFAPPGVATLP